METQWNYWAAAAIAFGLGMMVGGSIERKRKVAVQGARR